MLMVVLINFSSTILIYNNIIVANPIIIKAKPTYGNISCTITHISIIGEFLDNPLSFNPSIFSISIDLNTRRINPNNIKNFIVYSPFQYYMCFY